MRSTTPSSGQPIRCRQLDQRRTAVEGYDLFLADLFGRPFGDSTLLVDILHLLFLVRLPVTNYRRRTPMCPLDEPLIPEVTEVSTDRRLRDADFVR